MNNNLVPKQTVRSDGVLTTVHVNPDNADGTTSKSAKRAGKVPTPPTIAPKKSTLSVEGRNFTVTNDEGTKLVLDEAAARNLFESGNKLLMADAMGWEYDASAPIDGKGEVFIEMGEDAIVATNKKTGASVTLRHNELASMSNSLEESHGWRAKNWGWSQTSGYVSVVESPVGGEFEHNLAITLGPGAHFETYLSTVGYSDEIDDSNSTVSFSREGNSEEILVQLSIGDSESSAAWGDYESDTISDIDTLRSNLKALDPRLNVTDEAGEPTLLFDYKDSGETEGVGVSFYTANVMASALGEWRKVEHEAKTVLYDWLSS